MEELAFKLQTETPNQRKRAALQRILAKLESVQAVDPRVLATIERRLLKTGIDQSSNQNSTSLYGFVRNQPITACDPLGLVERGPGSVACQQATEQAEAALALYESEPTEENLEYLMQASLLAAFYCKPPPPPPPPPPDPVPQGPSPGTCETVKKTCFWTIAGGVLYWVCSEGSRLFPPRNFVPIP
jgi:hypothetical protein